MSIKELVEKLIDRTSDDLYQWENPRSDAFRLVLDNGSISIEKAFNSYGEIYIIKLYDKDSCFIQYSSSEEGASNLGTLYSAIEEYRKRAIERKISEVFGNI